MILEDALVELVKKVRCEACKNVAVREIPSERLVNGT